MIHATEKDNARALGMAMGAMMCLKGEVAPSRWRGHCYKGVGLLVQHPHPIRVHIIECVVLLFCDNLSKVCQADQSDRLGHPSALA
jgi:hypothetical protein